MRTKIVSKISLMFVMMALTASAFAPQVAAHPCQGADDECGDCTGPDDHNHQDTNQANGNQGCNSSGCGATDYNCYLEYLEDLIERPLDIVRSLT